MCSSGNQNVHRYCSVYQRRLISPNLVFSDRKWPPHQIQVSPSPIFLNSLTAAGKWCTRLPARQLLRVMQERLSGYRNFFLKVSNLWRIVWHLLSSPVDCGYIRVMFDTAASLSCLTRLHPCHVWHGCSLVTRDTAVMWHSYNFTTSFEKETYEQLKAWRTQAWERCSA